MHRIAAALGLTGAQERLYRQVLAASGTPLASLANGLLRTPEQLLGELDPLVRAGVVSVDGRGCLVVAGPTEAFGRVLAQHAAAMLEAGHRLKTMSQQLPEAEGVGPAPPPGQAVPLAGEVMSGEDAPDVVTGWVRETSGELLFLRPDQWRMPSESQMAVVVREAISLGRSVRAIYPARALQDAPATMIGRAAMGEQVRLLPEVPTRLVVVGDRVMMPEVPGLTDIRRLVVRQPGLVQLVTGYFEELWDRAVAVPGLERGETTPDLNRLLLQQLARGAKDEQIARILGISLRTVRRRVAALLTELGADSRFQAGVEAARRGWV